MRWLVLVAMVVGCADRGGDGEAGGDSSAEYVERSDGARVFGDVAVYPSIDGRCVPVRVEYADGNFVVYACEPAADVSANCQSAWSDMARPRCGSSVPPGRACSSEEMVLVYLAERDLPFQERTHLACDRARHLCQMLTTLCECRVSEHCAVRGGETCDLETQRCQWSY